MKLLLSLTIFAFSACATVAPHAKTPGAGEAPLTPGKLTISGDELRQTGRIELPDALRASSPLFQ
jgi:hypothetical protein